MSIFKKANLTRSQEPAPSVRPTVLVVDDEPANLDVMAMVLSPHFNVLRAGDGDEALRMVQDMKDTTVLDCIVSDHRMPRITGVQLFEQLLPIIPDTARIVVTGYIDVNVIVDAINKAQIYKFIVKPFDANDFLLTVQRAVESVSLNKQLQAYHAGLEDTVRQRTRELARERDFSLGLVKAIPEALFVISPKREIVMVNPNAARLLGRGEDELAGLPLASLVAQRDRESADAMLDKLFEIGDASCDVDLLFSPTNSVPHYLIGHRLSMDPSSQAIVVAVNIATRRQVEEQMRYLALYDALTELPNRTMLHDRLEHAIASARRRDARLAVLFVDLDGFKAVNDQAGHDAGDHILRVTGQRLKDAVRESDTVARYGGDEFVVLLPDIADQEAARAVALKIIEAVSQPVQRDGQDWRVGASVGVSLLPDHASEMSVLLELADAAMYRAKRGGRGMVSFAGDA